MNTGNSKTNELHRFILTLADKDKLNLKDTNLTNLSIYFKSKNMKSAYTNNKFKISATTWNHEFDLLDGS